MCAQTDSTIAPKTSDFLWRTFHGCSTRGRTLRNITSLFVYFLVCEGLSNDDVGEARGTVFEEMRPGVGLKTGDFVKEKLEGPP